MTFLAEKHLRLAFFALGHGNTFAKEVAHTLSDEWLRAVEANPPKTVQELRLFVEQSVRVAIYDLSRGSASSDGEYSGDMKDAIRHRIALRHAVPYIAAVAAAEQEVDGER